MLDIKICGGNIVDGTGAPGYQGDVGIRDGKIVALGQVAEEAREIIDAKGRIVAPGFIDVHTHYDAQAFWDPTFSPSCYHGVTTVIGGFCGFSIAPLTPDAGAYLLPMLARVEGMPVSTLKAGVPWNWSSFGDFLGKLDGTVGLNCGFFVGHSAVRRVVMGPRAVGQKATPEELGEMKGLVSKSLAEGALGFSTTTSISHNDADGNPVPSRHASREELIGLASLVRDHEGTSLELLPDVDFADSTIELLTDFSIAGQRAVNWNLLSVSGTDDAERKRIERQLYATQHARERGGNVVALTLPSALTLRINFISGFVLDTLTGWAEFFRLPVEERLERLKDPVSRAKLKESAQSTGPAMGRFANWRNYVVAEVQADENKRFRGRSVGEIADEVGRDPFDVLVDIVLADGLKTSLLIALGGDDAAGYEFRRELWESDATIVGGSDAGAHMDMIDSFAFSTKMLQNAREYRLMPIEQVVHLITQKNARFMGLRNRGVLALGAYADITVFDADRVACGEVYTRFDLPGTKDEGRLYADAVGIDYVIVNGKVLVQDNQIKDVRPGTVLRSGRDTYTVPLPEKAEAA